MAENQSIELIHYRLTQVEDKVEKIDGKLTSTVIGLETMKVELSQATGKQSTAISAIVSIVVGLAIGIGMKVLG